MHEKHAMLTIGKYGAAILPVGINSKTEGRRRWALISPDDYERASVRRWHVSPVKSKKSIRMYVTSRNGKHRIRLHRFIVGIDCPNIEVDHINGDPLDNRRVNLRRASRSQNCANRSSWKSDGVKGVYRKGSRWRAQIKCESGCVHLGIFSSMAEAAGAYNAAAIKHFGEFARLNDLAAVRAGQDKGRIGLNPAGA